MEAIPASNSPFVELLQLRIAFPNVSDGNLNKFLKHKRNPDRAVEVIETHKLYRSENSWIDNPPLRAHSDLQLRKILESELLITPTRSKDKLGRPCLFLCLRNNDFSDGRTGYDICRAILYNLERQLNRDDVLTNGIVLVCDLGGIQGEHCRIEIFQTIFSALSGKIPLRVKALYLISPPWFFGPVFAIASLFMSQKLKNRAVTLQNFNELYEFIDQDQIPEKYGGEIKHDQKEWVAQQIQEEQKKKIPLLEELVVLQTS
mmetsp:Transcript_30313/g.39975  ORF Transcript_30313/g.39975 Transcript_30313/m.39975 type:complete len:260 (-) Transcript_30313:178-957(-)|eukprot:CAMPEP_0117736614 /NCGR_PEP_ID=MMETSP0947-20121206/2037_1 /TAXON_ID=44440 /ORGANISM="Chattonella subsalsa, Strain CCMP2191" /LENGTH=259 /DNA_ID=CAMNT_0005551943 /DNA_START=85 /DNA_END=864 /DNA_ORIENTATION=-